MEKISYENENFNKAFEKLCNSRFYEVFGNFLLNKSCKAVSTENKLTIILETESLNELKEYLKSNF